jgi:hydroxyethylthiazole kinase
MQLITGMGCALTAVIAAFHAVCPNAYEASILATAYFGLCGMQAEKQSHLPGSFRTNFINVLHEPHLVMMERTLSEISYEI